MTLPTTLNKQIIFINEYKYQSFNIELSNPLIKVKFSNIEAHENYHFFIQCIFETHLKKTNKKLQIKNKIEISLK